MGARTQYIREVRSSTISLASSDFYVHRVATPLSFSGTPESRVTSVRDRLNIIRQCVLRNEHFAPSTLPSRDRAKLVTVGRIFLVHKWPLNKRMNNQLKSTKQLLGRFGERFLLLGMLAYNKEGKLCLEDADGSVVLDFSTLVNMIDYVFLSMLNYHTGRAWRWYIH